nr:hypothetical protein GCM10020063_056150 [Dactylosporangium thailandense]
MSALFERRLVFGAGGAVSGLSASQTLDLAQSADELGYDLFTLSDHLHSHRPTIEPFTALAWLAGRTTRIELGTNVLALPYRPPPVVAKTAETLDRISGGRFVLGLGGGGFDDEFRAFGLPERTPGQKITGQREAIAIIRSLWTQPTTTLHGSEFDVTDARIDPQPEHRIPIWLGSYGPRALALTGQLADGWIPSLGRIGLDRARQMRAAVRAAATTAGRDPDSITCACNIIVRIDPSLEPTPQAVVGSVSSVVGQLREVIAAGFTALLLAVATVAEQELIAKEVIPALRAEAASGTGQLPPSAMAP